MPHSGAEEYRLEFQSVWPYIPMATIYAMSVVFTMGYASSVMFSGVDATKQALPPLTALILLSGFVLIIGVHLFLPFIRNAWIRFWMIASDEIASATNSSSEIQPSSGTLDLLPFSVAFMIWLTYGSVMGAYPTFDYGPAQVVCGIWLLWLCLLQLSVVRGVHHIRKCVTFILYTAMIFVPSSHGVAPLTPWVLLIAKTTIAYILFVMQSVDGETVRYSKRRRSRWAHRAYLNSVECRVSQSAWVLLCPAVFMFAAAPLAAVLGYRIYQNTRSSKKRRKGKSKKPRGGGKRHHAIDPASPLAITYQTEDESGTDIENIAQEKMIPGAVYEVNGVRAVWTDKGLMNLDVGESVYPINGSNYKFNGTDFVPI